MPLQVHPLALSYPFLSLLSGQPMHPTNLTTEKNDMKVTDATTSNKATITHHPSNLDNVVK